MGIAKAFHQKASSLSEKKLWGYKVTMLDWDFCRALILSPSYIANRVHGLGEIAELFINAVSALKHTFLSRKAASVELSSEEDSYDDKCSSVQRKRRSCSSSGLESESKRSRLQALEDRMDAMFSSLSAKIDSSANVASRKGTKRNISDSDVDSENGLPHASDSEDLNSWSEVDQFQSLPKTEFRRVEQY
ncbi:unnamed protein product [Ceutorhynchus assimilis]|uniref:Uncharacterized protein n=1 Tax=Ceutorhynchus assimilis TaxID=467358 RepID=A0A9N9MT58_9CUCU|nr:unnamed protein product [Ceutorhynchus assimilis]